MNDFTNRSGDGGGAHSAGNKEQGAPVSSPRKMSLEGGEALDLYLAMLSRNAEMLKTQAALLQTALQERMTLVKELQSDKADSDQTDKADKTK
jgi:hypothetical protein